MTLSLTERIAERRGKNDSLFIVKLLVSVLAVLCIVMTVWGYVVIDGSSMENTLHDGDFVFINKLAEPQRGDIVVVDMGRSDSDYVIKRVIALEGDALYAENGVLYLCPAGAEGFTIVDEDYLFEEWLDISDVKPNTFGSEQDPLVIEKGCFFYMGDNRNDSYDCRAYGQQPIDHVLGVVTNWSMAIKDGLTSFLQIFTTCNR